MNLPKHMPALDGLRGVAILLVIFTHVGNGWPGAFSILYDVESMKPTFDLPAWLIAISGAGNYGVQLFFVVSAFTLTVRAAHDRNGLASYALRRIARVGPAYWIAGLAYTLVAGLGPRLWAPNGVTFDDLVIAAMFGSAWQGGASLAVVPGGWSVSCEVAFYIALPFLVAIIDGRIWRAIALTGVALLVAKLAAVNSRQAVLEGISGFYFYVNPIRQAPVFLFGMTAALVAMRVKLPRLPGIPAALLIGAIFVLPVLMQRYSHLHFAAPISVAVAYSAAYPPRFLVGRAIRRLGEVSYSMYLVHFALLGASLTIAEWLCPLTDWTTMLLHFALTTAATFVVASVTYRIIEQPPIRWASRFGTQRSPVPAAVKSA